jgi:polyhydroxyalkanoate synthase subunit PhaE
MTEPRTSPFWGDGWMDMQRRFWESWSSIYQKGLESATSAATEQQRWTNTPWSGALDTWWKMASGAAAPPAHDFLGKMVDQGKTFLQLGEEFAKFQEGMTKSAEGWQDLLNARFSEMKDAFSKSDPSGATRGLMAFWELPLDTWQRTLSSASVLPGDFLESLKPEAWDKVSDRLHERIERFLSVPGLGYTREWQEQGQELVRLAVSYQRALQEYSEVFRRLGVETLSRLQQKIVERSEQEQPVSSLRALYDLWVDAGEEAYMELVSTDEYAEIYGRLVNALMALKHQGRNMVDESLGALGMPTSKAMNTVQRRQQEIRRDLTALRLEFERLRANTDGQGRASAERETGARRGADATKRAAGTGRKTAKKTAAKRSRSRTQSKRGE